MSLASYQAAPPRDVEGILKQNLSTCKARNDQYNPSTMAHKKAGGSTQNGRDSIAKRRGVKRFGGQVVDAGEILVRQKGFWFRPGENTYLGKDWTIHATVAGTVKFSKMRALKFNGNKERCTVIHIEPVAV